MKQSKETWRAVHSVILGELEYRVGTEDSLTEQQLDFLADNLTDVVVAAFEVKPRR